MNMKTLIKFFGALFLVLVFTSEGWSKRELTAAEKNWVSEAKAKVDKAFSDPKLSKSERMQLVKEGARTLKEYGQATQFPQGGRGGMPISSQAQAEYDKAMATGKALNQLRQTYGDAIFNKKMNVINDIQIDVVGKQIQFLIPGKAPVDLSIEVVNKFFGFNIAEGFNRGDRGDANQLTKKFKDLKNLGDVSKQIEDAYKRCEEETKNWKRTIEEYKTLENELESEFNKTADATTTFKDLRDGDKDKDKEKDKDKDDKKTPPEDKGDDEEEKKDPPQTPETKPEDKTSDNESKPGTSEEKGAVWDKKGNKITLTEETDSDGNKTVIYTTTKDGKVIEVKKEHLNKNGQSIRTTVESTIKQTQQQTIRNAAQSGAKRPPIYSGGGGGGRPPCTCK